MSIPVLDPFGVDRDAALPTLRRCVDPACMQAELDRGVDGLGHGSVRLTAITVLRHKPGRRCLIEYRLSFRPAAGDETELTAIGKVRRNRPGRHQLRLLQRLWSAGFDARSADGISVPEPLGEIPGLSMWLQRRVSGVAATELLGGSRGVVLGARFADAAHKIHTADIATRKVHGIDDELRILENCLRVTAKRRPALASRIERLLLRCRRIAAAVDPLPHVGIHRDFYSDQVVVDGERLNVVDFDLYTAGDPALDIGNLIGHITEQALRELGSPHALGEVEIAAAERFAELRGGAASRRSVELYAALTVARHVFLADERPERASLVADLLDVAEERSGALI